MSNSIEENRKKEAAFKWCDLYVLHRYQSSAKGVLLRPTSRPATPGQAFAELLGRVELGLGQIEKEKDAQIETLQAENAQLKANAKVLLDERRRVKALMVKHFSVPTGCPNWVDFLDVKLTQITATLFHLKKIRNGVQELIKTHGENQERIDMHIRVHKARYEQLSDHSELMDRQIEHNLGSMAAALADVSADQGGENLTRNS